MVKIIIDNKKYALDIKNLYTMLTGKEEVEILDFSPYMRDSDLAEADIIIKKTADNYVAYSYEKHSNQLRVKITEKGSCGEKEKNIYKRLLFKVINTHTDDVRASWGILTGIRPVKIVNDLKKQDCNDAQIQTILKKQYLLSEEKISLLEEISKNQSSAIKKLQGDISIYIFIPFCPSRCYYCSFYSNDISKSHHHVPNYLDALEYEIKSTLSLHYFSNKKISSIYVGGGTPSSLDIQDLTRLFAIIKENFDLDEILEFTFEAGRVDTLNEEKLSLIKSSKVTRICLNPQTLNDATLAKIGRTHSAKDFADTFTIAKKLGFNDINCDLILGLMGESPSDMINSLEKVIAMNPENITLHTLSKKRTARLSQEDMDFEDLDLSFVMDEISKILFQKGYHPYYLYRQKNTINNAENIGFTKPAHTCLYNIAMMEEVQDVVGFGAGASTKLAGSNPILRIPNYKDIKLYINDTYKLIQRKKEALI